MSENYHKKLYDEGKLETTSGKEPKVFESPAPDPTPIHEGSNQHKDYWVLSRHERQQGFVRPVRHSYIHVGIPAPKYPLLDHDDENLKREEGWIKFEKYPEGSKKGIGRYWTQKEIDQINKGCMSKTTMGQALAETYARDPYFYGSTFCVVCNDHLPVGEHGEFIWADGSDERVGT